MNFRKEADQIIHQAINSVLPEEAVKKALKSKDFAGKRIYLVSVGKAAWTMAAAAVKCLEYPIEKGIVITKYQHVKGMLRNVTCYEAGHPVPDKNSFSATKEVLRMTEHLSEEDLVLFLVSGGASALFEDPLVSEEELQDITNQLLRSGADIVEMNTIRKRLSSVKGGKFALHCAPAKIYCVILSDIIGDPLDMIASGPACADTSTIRQAQEVVEKYHLILDQETQKYLQIETPKQISNVETCITGNVKNLCSGARKACEALGYKTVVLTEELNCEAREAGSFLASIARTYQDTTQDMAFLAGGETVVHLRGDGKGGRNQELALSSAIGIAGLTNVAIFSIGSDGTDGPTDAAGGFVDGQSKEILEEQNINIFAILEKNDAYHALQKCNGLIKTGATGTNVNDIVVLLIKAKQ